MSVCSSVLLLSSCSIAIIHDHYLDECLLQCGVEGREAGQAPQPHLPHVHGGRGVEHLRDETKQKGTQDGWRVTMEACRRHRLDSEGGEEVGERIKCERVREW